MPHTYPPAMTRRLIMAFTMMAAFMTQLDATIANVALPHMQASTAASREQIAWVLTSYLVMAATFTPLTGWLADRIGRKRVFIGSVAGFTIASVLCGLAVNLDQLIAFRLLQGIMGAALMPISQAIILDINPPEKHGSAMAIWGMGAVLGPIVGPYAGGWITENLSWRWIFFINIPFGVITFMALASILPEKRSDKTTRLDLFGFAMLAIAVATFQLMLDRGQHEDWFESREIWIEATIAATALYLFIVHTFTTRHPFVSPVLFRDRNYVIGNLLGFFLGGLMFGVIALVAPMLAGLMHYPIEFVGLVTMPRGIGTMLSMPIAGMLIGRVDNRVLVLTGMALCGWSLHMLSQANLAMDSNLVIVSGFVQGAGAAMVFVPVSTIVFATLPSHYRNEGAAFNALVRALGASMWISVLQIVTIRNEATVHSRLVESARPDNPLLDLRLPDFDFGLVENVAALNEEISRQALMVSYIDAYWLIFVGCVIVAPLILFVRPARRGAGDAPHPIMID